MTAFLPAYLPANMTTTRPYFKLKINFLQFGHFLKKDL